MLDTIPLVVLRLSHSAAHAAASAATVPEGKFVALSGFRMAAMETGDEAEGSGRGSEAASDGAGSGSGSGSGSGAGGHGLSALSALSARGGALVPASSGRRVAASAALSFSQAAHCEKHGHASALRADG